MQIGAVGYAQYPLEAYVIIAAEEVDGRFNITYWYKNSTKEEEVVEVIEESDDTSILVTLKYGIVGLLCVVFLVGFCVTLKCLEKRNKKKSTVKI